MDEPSVLDYLKSLIDPRRERIRIPPAEEQDGAGPEPLALGGTAPEVEADREPVARPGVEAAPPEVVMTTETPAPVPVERAAPPPDQPPQAGRWPWRAIAALVLSLAAQLALEPPAREPARGVVLYVLAAAAAVWGLLAGEWRPAPLPRVRQHVDSFSIRRNALLTAAVLTLLAFFALGGNRFTAFNVLVWGLAIGYTVAGFWLPGKRARLWWLQVRAFLRRPRLDVRLTSQSLLVLAAVALVLFFRFYRLEQVPPEMFSDHAEKLQDVLDVLTGQTRIFFPRNTGREAFQMYLTAFTARYLGFGLTFMALKMGTALAGLFTFPFIYLLGAELANRRVGLLAVVLAGISYWLNVITRVALRFSLYSLFAAPTLYFLARGLRRQNRNDFIWAGFFLGLGLHGYSPFRLVPFMVVILVGLYLLHRRTARHIQQTFWNLSIVVVVSFVVFLPLLRFVLESPQNREIFTYRSLTRLGTVERDYPAPVGEVFLDNLWRGVTMFAWDNGVTWVHSVPSRPALEVVSAALFHLGVVLLAVRYVRRRQWEDAFLLLSVVLLIMPSVLSLAFPAENPSLNRTAGAVVPVFLIAAVALDAVMNAFERGLGGRRGRQAGWGVAVLLLVWSSFNNYDLIFNRYFRQFQAGAWNTTELGAVIRGFADSVGSEDTAWVIPWPHWVDTRLVGINAGVPVKDYAIPRERLYETVEVPGVKLFLFKPEDLETLQVLNTLYPNGVLSTYTSKVPTKDFMLYLVISDSPPPSPTESPNLPERSPVPGEAPYP